jgi:transcription elongation factor Elf1
MNQVNCHHLGHIKNKVYNQLSGMECPACEDGKMYVGAVSESEQAEALYCVNCETRIAVLLVLTDVGDITLWKE